MSAISVHAGVARARRQFRGGFFSNTKSESGRLTGPVGSVQHIGRKKVVLAARRAAMAPPPRSVPAALQNTHLARAEAHAREKRGSFNTVELESPPSEKAILFPAGQCSQFRNTWAGKPDRFGLACPFQNEMLLAPRRWRALTGWPRFYEPCHCGRSCHWSCCSEYTARHPRLPPRQ